MQGTAFLCRVLLYSQTGPTERDHGCLLSTPRRFVKQGRCALAKEQSGQERAPVLLNLHHEKCDIYSLYVSKVNF